jgi:hypothetical protein
LLLAGCKVDAKVDVTLRADGSGTVTTRVTLDADAVKRLTPNAPLAQAVPLADMRAAGWKISEWSPTSDGGQTITVSHDFVGRNDLAGLLVDLTGRTRAIWQPEITHTRGYFGAKDAIAVQVDLTHLSPGIRTDTDVAKALANAGVDVKTLNAQLRNDLDKSFTLDVTVHAPNGETKSVSLKSGATATVSATSMHTYTSRIVLVAVGVVLLVLALLLTAASLASKSRRRRTSSASPRR